MMSKKRANLNYFEFCDQEIGKKRFYVQSNISVVRNRKVMNRWGLNTRKIKN